MKVSSRAYYGEYHGHLPSHLNAVHHALRQLKGNGDEGSSLMFLAGDSSLDNKYWLSEERSAKGLPYDTVLEPPRMKPDIAYWLTKECKKRENGVVGAIAAINGAIEESTVADRFCGALRAQDIFIRDHIRSNDILVVSVGGNDIALRPNCCTICNMLGLICCTPTKCIEKGCAQPLPCDECCPCGCGAGCLSTVCSCPPCGGYFAHLFKSRITAYIDRLTSKTRPKAIAVCMIYYPDEQPSGSWADPILSLLGYNSNPTKLQLLIRKIYAEATSKILIPNTTVVPVALFDELDGSNSRDYVARVEPSVTGGEKMAKLISDRLEDAFRGHSPRYGACSDKTPIRASPSTEAGVGESDIGISTKFSR